MLLPVFLSLASLALADNRVFASRGSEACKSCLGEVEAACKGPITSDQFNDCFCSVGDEGLAWPKLADCVAGSNAPCSQDIQYDILGDWGAHCFAYKKDEEEEVCVDSTQNNALLMSVADVFCTEFLTLTSQTQSSTPTAVQTPGATTTTTSAGVKETTVSGTSTGAEESTAITTSAPSTTTSAASNPASSTGAGAATTTSAQNNGGVSSVSAVGIAPVALLALAISGLLM